ncbi:Gfo/Idh/MocA family oxidoreductase, partial [Verrucomicrobia bacterium]|nr:Gfo/Idh/MocA family oxidoreductase [Verrucomicrobiota bacterium]
MNGFNANAMDACPYPGIRDYLQKQTYPDDFLTRAKVVSVWCEDRDRSSSIAAFANIPHVAENLDALISQVDGVLLARDDAENHFRFAMPVIERGLPIYVDKPLGYSVAAASKLLDAAQEGYIFSCSALRYDTDLQLTAEEKMNVGELKKIHAVVMKSWAKYAIHLLEPLFAGELKDRPVRGHGMIQTDRILNVFYRTDDGLELQVSEYPDTRCGIALTYIGNKGAVTKRHVNSFLAFRTALERFIEMMEMKRPPLT